MNGRSQASDAGAARQVEGRDRAQTAAARCACYAAWSELTASPHDHDPRPDLANRRGAGAGLDGGEALEAAIEALAGLDLPALKRAYSALFEVGSEGPPVPIREDLQTGMRAGTREDVVRFYEFFGYRLEERFAWAPDHLSVELEFMHFLCYAEASAEDAAAALPFQLAQLDFAERHLCRWVPGLARAAAEQMPDSPYVRVLGALALFIEVDHGWQAATVVVPQPS